jgi:SWIM zinc finger
MKLDLRYWGKSGMRDVAGGAAMTFEPNLSRNKVFFDAELVDPVRFREAISALHAVVVGDLRFQKKDKPAYKAFLALREKEEQALRQATHDRVKVAEAQKIAKGPVPKDLEPKFRKMHRLYWDARVRWAHELSANDPGLFRALVPCDPVVTVAPDVVMFECFAKDEASYGCLSVDRDAFRGADKAELGTTNVDYSLALFDHFQTMRTYRPTRLLVDPTGFEVVTSTAGALREEKIDLPASWLRGFGQLQAAMALPARHVELSVDVVYSLLAYLKRNREKTGPRALSFVLVPGKQPQIVIEPWGVTLTSRGKPYDGPGVETIKVWGRRRLMAFARTLPICDRFDVSLLGTGLPSVWVARMGEMRMTIALSGWTTNDWAGGSSLDQYFAGFEAREATVDRLANHLEVVRSATLAQLVAIAGETDKVVLGSLHALAKRGQLAYDFATGIYRWRPILPVALSEAMLGPEPEEVVEGKRLATSVTVERRDRVGAKQLVVAKVKNTACEALFDHDGVISRAKCTCSFFHRMRLRAGPCRHLLALRMAVLADARPAPLPMARIGDHPYR